MSKTTTTTTMTKKMKIMSRARIRTMLSGAPEEGEKDNNKEEEKD